MAKFDEATQRFIWDEPKEGSFDWSLYEDGWNGKSLKRNKSVKASHGEVIYCHENYANDLYKKFEGIKVVANKELTKDALVSINDIELLDENTLMVSINGGSNNVIVDLNKEDKFFSQFSIDDDGNKMTKDIFVNSMKSNPSFKATLLGMDLSAKITNGDVEKASIWNGYVETLTREMKEQITKKSKAYFATIVSTNRGGFVVDIMNTIKAFMPGSMAAANRVTDFDSMIGTTFEVMVESWDANYGFVVSRKKFLKTMLPAKLNELQDKVDENADTLFTGHVTGSTPFGVFVELDEFITGMLHKTLVNDETREAMRNGEIVTGSEIQVYVHKIEKNRVILSNVPTAERNEVIARREAEETAEKEAVEKEKSEDTKE